MDLTIIIISFNTKDDTRICLESIFFHLRNKCKFEIIVVDNNSTDGSIAYIKEYLKREPSISLIANNDNLGFGRANNLGIHISSGKQILFLNSDAFLIDDSLLLAMKHLSSHPDIFGCGCTLLNKDGTTGPSYGQFPEIKTIIKEILLNKFCSLRAISPSKPDQVYPIDFPCGAFFLVNKEILNIVGGFDENFFMYFEETDLAKRAWKYGYKIVFYGFTKAVHIGGQSSTDKTKKAINPQLRDYFYSSWRYYLQKHCNGIERFFIRYLLFLYFHVKLYILTLIHRVDSLNSLRHEIKSFTKAL
ncbi:MAG: glycosyltransferase family 2 protein [Paludibacteraceae bacterium]|nr:glycosyltransferase family 2 protein [Paludibacteraceae bacterium]